MTSSIVVGPNIERQLRSILRKLFLVPTLIIVFSFGSFTTAFSQQPATTNPTTTSQAAPPIDQMAPMRDGVMLSTIIYLPEGQGPWLVVLVRTPYGKASQTRLNGAWTKHGFALWPRIVAGLSRAKASTARFWMTRRTVTTRVRCLMMNEFFIKFGSIGKAIVC